VKNWRLRCDASCVSSIIARTGGEWCCGLKIAGLVRPSSVQKKMHW
jgi:hypothetical protein